MERKYYFDKELHVLRAGRAQFFAKFTVFYVLYSKKSGIFSGFRIAYIIMRKINYILCYIQKKWNFFQDLEHVLGAGRAQLCAKFTILHCIQKVWICADL